jgi:hypothetical protein
LGMKLKWKLKLNFKPKKSPNLKIEMIKLPTTQSRTNPKTPHPDVKEAVKWTIRADGNSIRRIARLQVDAEAVKIMRAIIDGRLL